MLCALANLSLSLSETTKMSINCNVSNNKQSAHVWGTVQSHPIILLHIVHTYMRIFVISFECNQFLTEKLNPSNSHGIEQLLCITYIVSVESHIEFLFMKPPAVGVSQIRTQSHALHTWKLINRIWKHREQADFPSSCNKWHPTNFTLSFPYK